MTPKLRVPRSMTQTENVSVEEYRTLLKSGAAPLTVAEHNRKKQREQERPDYAGILAKQCEASGFAVTREYLYARPRLFRADLLVLRHARYKALSWETVLFIGGVLVEIQGGIFNEKAHGSISGILKDNERLNEASIYHYRMLRMLPEWIVDRKGRPVSIALTLIERALKGASQQ